MQPVEVDNEKQSITYLELQTCKDCNSPQPNTECKYFHGNRDNFVILRLYSGNYIASLHRVSPYCTAKARTLEETTKKEVNIETYNERNGAHQSQDSKDLFDQISNDGVKDVKILLEVGCGSGNVTKLVSETIPHEKMYSCVIDPAMVEHAMKLNGNNPKKIDFFIQDISAPWEALHRTLHELEGKVDLLWSNRVLHWIPDDLRHRAAQNIVRLLRKGGRFYINTTLTVDPLHPSLSPEARSEFEKLMQVPSIETQHEWWREYFSTAGLSSLKVDYIERSWDYGTNQIFRELLDYQHFWKRYIPGNIPVEQHDDVLKKLGEATLISMGHPIGQPALNPLETLTVVYYGEFRIIGAK